MKSWQIQEAKSRFSELLSRAATRGPQGVTRHGKRVAVVLSVADFERMSRPRQSLLEFFRAAPTRGVRLKIERDRSPGRDIDL